MPSANDRLKATYGSRVWAGVSISAMLHFIVLTLGPTLAIPDFATAEAPPMVVQPPDAKLPAPPAPLPRPAAPSFSDPTVDPSATLPTISFDEYVAPLTPPTSQDTEADREQFHAFVPSMTPPRLLNAAEVERALREHYPRMLRDAGIGGEALVQLWLDQNGRVVRAAIARSSSYPALDEAALAVVEIMRLSPAENRGRPVRVVVSVPMRFTVQ